MKQNAPVTVSVAFAVIAILVALAFVAGTGVAARRLGEPPKAQRRVVALAAAGVTAWMAATAAAAATGVLSRFEARPPPFLLLMVATLAIALAIGFSRAGARLATGLPLAALVGVQAFRFPLEIAMHAAARAGVMPERMSFTGSNYDIVTGVLAIPLAIVLGRGATPRRLILAWNALGLVLLANVVAIAMLSTPMIHAFGTDPRELSTFVAYMPFVWLPAVMVATALAGHIVVARRLAHGARAVLSA